MITNKASIKDEHREQRWISLPVAEVKGGC